MHGWAGHLCDNDVSRQFILHHTTRDLNAGCRAAAQAHPATRRRRRAAVALEVNVAVSVRKPGNRTEENRDAVFGQKMTKTEPEMEMVKPTQP